MFLVFLTSCKEGKKTDKELASYSKEELFKELEAAKDSNVVNSIKNKLEILEFIEASKSNSNQSIKSFLKKNPNSDFKDFAQHIINWNSQNEIYHFANDSVATEYEIKLKGKVNVKDEIKTVINNTCIKLFNGHRHDTGQLV